MKPTWVMYVALVVGAAWAGYWLWFGVVAYLGKEWLGLGAALVGWTFILVLLAPFVAALVLAWRRPVPGGGLLILEALILCGLPWISWRPTKILDSLPLVLPPLVAGILFLAAGLSSRPHRAVPPTNLTDSESGTPARPRP